MKTKTILLTLLAGLSLLAGSARATVIATENFSSNGNLWTQNGGTGWTTAWGSWGGTSPTVSGGQATISYGNGGSQQAIRGIPSQGAGTVVWLRFFGQVTTTLSGTTSSYGCVGIDNGGTDLAIIGKGWPGNYNWSVSSGGTVGQTTKPSTAASVVYARITTASSITIDLWINPANSSTITNVTPDATQAFTGTAWNYVTIRGGLGQAGTESWKVSNLVIGTALADVAVSPAPVITAQPASVSVYAGQTTNFTVAVAGNAPLTYQWQTNGVNLANAGNVSGVTSNVLTITGATLANSATNYSCYITNTFGSVTSSVASLVVATNPTFSAQTPTPSSVIAPTLGVSTTNVLSVQIQEGSLLNTNTIVLQLDGATVTPVTVTQNSTTYLTTVSYFPGSPMSAGATHAVQVTVADSLSHSFTNSWSFTTAFAALPATLPGPIVVTNMLLGVGTTIFSTADAWVGTNYNASSARTLYTRFSVNFLNLDGETGTGNGFGGLEFYQGGTEQLLVGNDWASLNWSVNSPANTDIPPSTVVVLNTWHTLVVRTDYAPGGNAAVKVWLDPNFTLTEANQTNGPLTISRSMTFDSIHLRCGTGTASASFSNIVVSALGTDVGFAVPTAPLFQSLVPGANQTVVPVTTPIGFQVVVGSVPINTNSISLTVDGSVVTPSFTISGNIITANYQPGAPFSVAGSTHTNAVSLTDTNGTPYSINWSFTVDPYPALPVNVAGPITVSNAVDNIIFAAPQNEWIGTNYGTTSTNTLYTRFSMACNNLIGTGASSSYAGLEFDQGTGDHLIMGKNWPSTNWGMAWGLSGAHTFDLTPVVPIVLHQWHTMVLKSVYASGTNTAVKIWLDPDFTATEANQTNAPLVLSAGAVTFDSIHLRAGPTPTSAQFSNIVITATAPGVGFAVPISTTLGLASSVNPSTYGGSVTFTATVQTNSVTAGTATGNLVFQLDGAAVATNAVASGAGSYTYGLPTAGTHTITATYSGGGAYVSSTASLTQTVNQAGLTITANNDSKTYDGNTYATNNGVTYAGFVNGETNTALTGSLSYSGSAIGATYVGIYNITPGGYSSANYLISYVDGTLTISPLGVTVTADPQTKVYGSADPALTYGFSPALVVGDSFTGALSRVAGETVGSFAINQNTLALSTNYNLTYVGTNLTITAASLVVTADSTGKTYGQTVVFAGTEFTTAGLTNGDMVSSVILTSGGATNTATIGSYSIVATGATGSGLGNYSVSYGAGSLTVTPLAVNLTGVRAYDGTTNAAGTDLAVTNAANGDAVTLTGTGGLAGADAGTNAITSFAGLSLDNGAGTNYTLASAAGAIIITNMPLTVTANDDSQTYSGVGYSGGNGATYAGFVNGETNTALTGSLSYGGSASGATTVGTYNITPAGYSSANYLISYVHGTLTINQATPVIGTAPTAGAIVYGQTLGDSALGGGSATPAGGSFAFTSPATVPPLGTVSYSVTYTPLDTTDYTNATTTVSVTVNPACTAPAIIGGISPASLTATVGDQVVLALTNVTGTATFAYQWLSNTVAITGATYGSYTNLSVTVADAGSYQVIVTNGCGAITSSVAVLTVNAQTPLVATLPTAGVITYGQALSASALTGGSVTNAAGATVPGSFAYTSPGTTPNAGTPSEGVTFTPTDTNNYNHATASVSVTVNQALPVVSWSNPADITYGTALSGTQLNATAGGVAGSYAYTPTNGTVLAGGNSQTLSVQFTPTDGVNYSTPAAKTAAINVLLANQTITFGALGVKTVGDAPFALGATASSGLTVSYASSVPTVASVSGGMVTILTAGSTTITASQSGNGNYNAATAVPQVLTVNALPVLGLRAAGTNLILSWPTNTEAGFGLESATNLKTPAWVGAGAATVVGGQNVVTNAIVPNANFYHLKK